MNKYLNQHLNHLIEKFNALDGKIVTRKYLLRLKSYGNLIGGEEIAQKIEKLLKNHPKTKLFNITIKKPIKKTSTKKELTKKITPKKNEHEILDLLGLNGVINIDTDKFCTFSKKQLRSFLLEYYNQNLKGKTIVIKNSISRVELLNRAGRKISVGSAIYKSKVAVIEQLESVIKQSTYNNWGNPKTTDSKDLLGYMNFKSKITIDGEKRHVRVVIEVFKDRKTLLKTYEVGKKKPRLSKESPKLSSSPNEVQKKKESLSKSKNTKNKPTIQNPLKASVLSHIKKMSLEEFANDFAYVFSQDLDKISWRIEDKKTYNEYVKRLLEKVISDKKYLKVIGFTEKLNGASAPKLVAVKTGALNKGISAPVPQIKGLQPVSNRPKLAPLGKFKIAGAIARLLGNIEIKPKGSVAVTLDAPAGSGKTRFFFQVMNELANQGYKVLFVSLEEHPESILFQDKLDQYITKQNQERVFAIDDDNFEEVSKHINDFDIVLFDSWNKIVEKNKGIDFDNDLRKKFDGKLFFTIFQRTTTGSMRGGSKAQFDGDIILKVNLGNSFKTNYVYNEKNRYNHGNFEELKYIIYSKKIVKSIPPKKPLKKPPADKKNLKPKPKVIFANKKIVVTI